MTKIKVKNQEVLLDEDASEVEAAKVYDVKARELYGEHAFTNF